MFSVIRAYQYVALRLPSDNIKVEQILPNTLVSLGKYGAFPSNQIIGRPYHLTFEIPNRSDKEDGRAELRVVTATELNAEAMLEEAEPGIVDEASNSESTPAANQYDEYGLPDASGKSNVNTIDDTNIQKLSYLDIEALKSSGTSDPKELIAKIMENHGQIDQKTAFSLAKYTLRKQKKYMKRFTVLPLDTTMLADWMMAEKDFGKIMELRNETLGLIGSWSNVHASASSEQTDDAEPGCRYLVVDDTGGLIVAAMAERMGILHQSFDKTLESNHAQDPSEAESQQPAANGTADTSFSAKSKRKQHDLNLTTSNSITLVHANQQPNLSMLRYFNFDPNTPPSPSDPTPPHPLYTHLRTLTWLQLLHPDQDTTYSIEPTLKGPEELSSMKPNHRSTYLRKRRRWTRIKTIVDETRTGGFNALIVASYTDPISICRYLIPLLAGGAQIVIYSPHVEPLLPLVDAYATARRAAFLQLDEEERERVAAEGGSGSGDFPVDPTLTLGFTMQTARVRRWQVLPGRTHPLMMGRGGSEGYVATATRVIPLGGRVQARGKQPRNKKRKMDGQLAFDGADAMSEVEGARQDGKLAGTVGDELEDAVMAENGAVVDQS